MQFAPHLEPLIFSLPKHVRGLSTELNAIQPPFIPHISHPIYPNQARGLPVRPRTIRVRGDCPGLKPPYTTQGPWLPTHLTLLDEVVEVSAVDPVGVAERHGGELGRVVVLQAHGSLHLELEEVVQNLEREKMCISIHKNNIASKGIFRCINLQLFRHLLRYQFYCNYLYIYGHRMRKSVYISIHCVCIPLCT